MLKIESQIRKKKFRFAFYSIEIIVLPMHVSHRFIIFMELWVRRNAQHVLIHTHPNIQIHVHFYVILLIFYYYRKWERADDACMQIWSFWIGTEDSIFQYKHWMSSELKAQMFSDFQLSLGRNTSFPLNYSWSNSIKHQCRMRTVWGPSKKRKYMYKKRGPRTSSRGPSRSQRTPIEAASKILRAKAQLCMTLNSRSNVYTIQGQATS